MSYGIQSSDGAKSSGGSLRDLIEEFAALDPEERQRQIEIANAYLATAEGRAEFGLSRLQVQGYLPTMLRDL